MQIFIDEAGRGPLAGPMYVGLVKKIKNPDQIKENSLFTDSKKLSPAKRLLAYQAIQKHMQNGEILANTQSISAEFIDRYGITRALNIAISKGIYEILKQENHKKTKRKAGSHQLSLPLIKNTIQKRKQQNNEKITLIIDGKHDFKLSQELGITTETIIKGDQKVLEISIASILAKVERDLHMDKMAEIYPNYDFQQHKGYGTKAHYQAIAKYGLCAEHRKLFFKKLIPNWKISPFDRETSALD